MYGIQLKQADCCVMVHPQRSNRLPLGGSNEKEQESDESEENKGEVPSEEIRDERNDDNAAYLDERCALVRYLFTLDIHGTTAPT